MRAENQLMISVI